MLAPRIESRARQKTDKMSEHLSIRGVAVKTKTVIAAEAVRRKVTQAAIVDEAIRLYLCKTLGETKVTQPSATDVTQLDRIERIIARMAERAQ